MNIIYYSKLYKTGENNPEQQLFFRNIFKLLVLSIYQFWILALNLECLNMLIYSTLAILYRKPKVLICVEENKIRTCSDIGSDLAAIRPQDLEVVKQFQVGCRIC